MWVTLASNPLLKTTFHLQTLSLLSNHFAPSDEVWLLLFIDMKRSGSENNLVGKGQNLSQEFWPATVKIKFLVARVRLCLPHIRARAAFLFYLNLFTIFSLSRFVLIWRGLREPVNCLIDLVGNREFTIWYFQCITAKSAPATEKARQPDDWFINWLPLRYKVGNGDWR